MNKPITVDPKVHDLAAHWLSDDDTAGATLKAGKALHDLRVMSLAADIQRAIEDWCEDEIREQERQDERDAEMRATGGRSI